MGEAFSNLFTTVSSSLTSLPVFWEDALMAAAYMAAGVLLLANLKRIGILKKNKHGQSIAAIFILLAITHLLEIASTSGVWSVWMNATRKIAGVYVALVIVWLSSHSRFVVGGYDELVATRRELEQSERWMKIMQDHTSDGLAVYAPDGQLLYINPAAMKMLDLDLSDSSDVKRMQFEEVHQNRTEGLGSWKDVLSSRLTHSKITTERANGELKVIEVNFSPVKGKVRGLIAVAVTYRDISVLHNLEKAKEEFIQIASHELRTPLTAVKGFLTLLKLDKYGQLTPPQTNFVEKALLASSRLSNLVDNLLLVARIEESRVKLNEELVDLKELINTTVQELAGEADRCAINLRVIFPSNGLPLIMADSEKVRHILSNLIANAIKYTPEGGHVFVESRFKNDQVEVIVSDTGVGIAAEDMKKLFHKFERIKNSRSVRVGGSGLGLIVVKSFTELHGGKVSVNSQIGKGSTFTVSLPIKTENNIYV